MNSATNRARQLAAIHLGHGMLKRKPGDNPFVEEWAEHKREKVR